MAASALVNQYLALNSSTTGITGTVKSAVLVMEAANLDSTAHGDNWVEATPGLKSGTLAVTFNDDVSASAIDSVLWGLFGTVVTFEVRLDAGSVGADNPKYTGSVLIAQHAIGGQVGDLAAKTLTFPLSGAVTRATS